jgi:S-adenosylmethionine synthetase
VPEDDIASALRETFDFRPRAIIETLGLRRPIYTATAAYGHFGRKAEEVESPIRGVGKVSLFPWERTDKVDALRTALHL